MLNYDFSSYQTTEETHIEYLLQQIKGIQQISVSTRQKFLVRLNQQAPYNLHTIFNVKK